MKPSNEIPLSQAKAIMRRIAAGLPWDAPDAPKKRERPSKYAAVAVVVDGMRFHSKKEARYYEALKVRRAAGECWFLMQAPFHLPGGVRYVVDFVVFEKDGRVRFVDVKGMRTKEYVAKRKIVEALYPVRIEEV